MVQIIENSQNFPLQVKRTADRLYTIEAVGLGLGKTGTDLTALEASVRVAVDEILLVSKRHGLERIRDAETVIHSHSTTDPTPVDSLSKAATDAPGVEDYIMRWARIALIIFVISLVVGWGAKQAIMSQFDLPAGSFEITGNAHVYAKGLARVASKTAQVLESVTPDRRNEVIHNLHRIAISLQPYAAQMRPIWLACCGPQEAYLSQNASEKVKKPVALLSKE